MGASGSKTAGNAAAAAAKTDARSGRLQDSRSPSPRAGLDPAANFFRPLRANDGSLAPFAANVADADVERRVLEKDVTLVRRMDRLAGAVSMSRVEISGHRRAAERAAKRREAMARTSRIRVQDLAAFFRERSVNGHTNRKAEDAASERLAERLEAPVVAAATRFFRHAEPVSVTAETKMGGPPIVRLIKRWDAPHE